MNIKELERIINRDDYKRMSIQLKEKTEELAAIVREKMESLHIEYFHEYCITTLRSRFSTRSFLSLCELRLSLEDIELSYCLDMDCTCRIVGASNDDALNFLNNFNSIMKELDDLETSKTEAIRKALENINL